LIFAVAGSRGSSVVGLTGTFMRLRVGVELCWGGVGIEVKDALEPVGEV
jgi:hypothetical protein